MATHVAGMFDEIEKTGRSWKRLAQENKQREYQSSARRVWYHWRHNDQQKDIGLSKNDEQRVPMQSEIWLWDESVHFAQWFVAASSAKAEFPMKRRTVQILETPISHLPT